jgi:hypothetical protein
MNATGLENSSLESNVKSRVGSGKWARMKAEKEGNGDDFMLSLSGGRQSVKSNWKRQFIRKYRV